MIIEDLLELGNLPKIPKVEGLERTDHITFIALPEDEKEFYDYCTSKGLSPAEPIVTSEYPAKHIAFIKNNGPCSDEPMIGLSIPGNKDSPIYKSLQLYGTRHLIKNGKMMPGRVQHMAYEVGKERTMDDVCDELIGKGVKFMSDILRHQLSPTQLLEQVFVACDKPYGEFIEIIKRTSGRYSVDSEGKKIQGFASRQIDRLYGHYDRYSADLISSSR